MVSLCALSAAFIFSLYPFLPCVGGIYPPNLYIGEIKEVSVDDNELVKKIVVESPINYNNVFRVVIMENEYEIKQ